MSVINKLRKQDIVYYLGIALGILFVLAVIIYKAVDMDQYLTGVLPECYIRKTTGLICPGCGMTRSVRALLNLKLVKSCLYHIIPVYGLFCYLYLMIKESRHRLAKTDGISEKIILKLIYIGIGLDIIQWIIKLICMYVFRIKML